MGNCTNSITVNAMPEAVWKRISDFHDLTWSGGVITSVDKVGPKSGNQIGAQRVLNKVFHETLLSLDDGARTFTYSIDDGPEPVSKQFVTRYVGTVKVGPGRDESTAKVDWTSDFTSSRDEDVQDFCNPIYRALLQGLKNSYSG